MSSYGSFCLVQLWWYKWLALNWFLNGMFVMLCENWFQDGFLSLNASVEPWPYRLNFDLVILSESLRPTWHLIPKKISVAIFILFCYTYILKMNSLILSTGLYYYITYINILLSCLGGWHNLPICAYIFLTGKCLSHPSACFTRWHHHGDMPWYW